MFTSISHRIFEICLLKEWDWSLKVTSYEFLNCPKLFTFLFTKKIVHGLLDHGPLLHDPLILVGVVHDLLLGELDLVALPLLFPGSG